MNDQQTTSALYGSRPIVLLDGRSDIGLTGGLLTLLVEETTAGLYRCEMNIGNWGTTSGEVGYLYFDRSVVDFAREIAVKIGDGDAAATVFEGSIMGIEARYLDKGPPELTILSEDRCQDLRMTRRTRTFENVSDRDVIAQIAAQHSLRADIDIDGPMMHKVLAQVNQSDLAFIRERAQAVDAEVWVEANALRVQSRRRRKHEDVTLTFGQRLREFSVLADLAGQSTTLTVSGWNVSAKATIAHEAGESVIRDELNGGRSGSNLLSAAVGTRKEQLVHTAPITDEEARYLAEAYFRRKSRRFVTGAAVAEGDGRIRVGTYVELAGLGSLFNGKYYVVAVRHSFDGINGYLTDFRVERPWIGQN